MKRDHNLRQANLVPRPQSLRSTSNNAISQSPLDHQTAGSSSQVREPTQGEVLMAIRDSVKPMPNMALNIALPAHMTFNSLSLGKGNSGSYAFDAKTGVGMAVVALAQNLTPAQLMNLVRAQESKPEIPNLQGVLVGSFSQPREVPAIQDSGLAQALIWSGKNRQGAEVHIAYAPRLDQKGVHVIIMSGSKDYFDQNDDYLDYLYRNMRAGPQAK
ncbi:MAG: hypothetical protein AB7K41_03470 [Bdellovibrionales bacterium]